MIDPSHPFYVSASELAAPCLVQFWHQRQRYRDGLLATDRTAAGVSTALHDACMEFHRQAEQAYIADKLPSPTAGSLRLRALVDNRLHRNGLNRAQAGVAQRLARVDGGLDRVASLIVGDMPSWAVDPKSGDLLVWVEATLDHGRGVRAVEIAPGYLVGTRPDVIGLRVVSPGVNRVVVRDYKAKGEVVDPAADDGIIVRALWAMLELQHPRCAWFMAEHTLPVDATLIDLETVNLLHADGDGFLVRRTMTVTELLAHRDRLATRMDELHDVVEAVSAGDVLASPGGLCLNWCPFLDRCKPGKAHVRKYYGDGPLDQRLTA